MATLVGTALFILALGIWMLVDPRAPLWIAQQNERISRRIYDFLRTQPPEYAYGLTRSVIRWVLPASFVAASIAQLIVALT